MTRYAMLTATALLLAGPLAGCAAPATVVAVTEVPSLMATGKTLDDNISSGITHQDCSIERKLKGGPYCVPVPPAIIEPRVTRVTYCYRSLAKVSCYDAPVARDAEGFVGIRVDQVAAITE